MNYAMLSYVVNVTEEGMFRWPTSLSESLLPEEDVASYV